MISGKDLKVTCEINIVHCKLNKMTRIPVTSLIFDHFLERIIVIFRRILLLPIKLKTHVVLANI